MVEKKRSVKDRNSNSASNVIPLNNRRKKKKKKNYKVFLLTILVLSLLIYIVFFTPFFNINNIEVYGNEKFSQNDIINSSGLTYGQNIFKANFSEIKKNVLKNQYIKDIKISRRLLGTVKFNIIERKPVAYFELLGSDYIIIDNEGIVLDKLQSIDSLNIPNIMGLEFKNYTFGSKLGVKEHEADKFDTILECINSGIEYGLNDQISRIDISQDDSPMLYLDKAMYQVNLGDTSEINYKYKSLSNILEMEGEKAIDYIIDFTLPSKPSIEPKY